MRKGDLVLFRGSNEKPQREIDSSCVGLIVDVQARGPLPGAYVLWPNENKAEWIKIESLIRVESVVSR